MPSRYFLISPRQIEETRRKNPDKPRQGKEIAPAQSAPPLDLSEDISYDLNDAELDDMLKKGELTEEYTAPLPDLASFDDDAVEHEYDERLKEVTRAANESSPTTKKTPESGIQPKKKGKNFTAKLVGFVGSQAKKALSRGWQETRKALESPEGRAKRLVEEFDGRLKGIFAAEGNTKDSFVPSALELIKTADISNQELSSAQDLNDIAYLAQQKLNALIESNPAINALFSETEWRKAKKIAPEPLPPQLAQRVSALTMISRFAIDVASISKALIEDKKNKRRTSI